MTIISICLAKTHQGCKCKPSSQFWKRTFTVSVCKCPVKCPVNASQLVNCSTQQDRWWRTPVTVAGPVRGTWSWWRLADLRLEQSAQYDVGWQYAARYDGARPWMHCTAQQSGLVSDPLSDWQPVKLLQNWLYSLTLLAIPVMIRAAAFWITCRWCISWPLTSTKTTSNKRVYQCLPGLDRQWPLDWPQLWTQKEADRLSAAMWLPWSAGCQAERQDRWQRPKTALWRSPESTFGPWLLNSNRPRSACTPENCGKSSAMCCSDVENDVIFQRILNTWIVSKYVCET